ncbi:MAG TPA: flagellar FliJ family protein [Anaerovoracaceae bacterium]|nr:flagellar FliJ family protein [Anaerovoracaceae bacterium]
MKKFEFQLEKLLSYKGQMLDSELMNLAVLNNQLSDAQHKRLALQTEQEQCKTEFENKMLEKTTPATCQMYTFYTEHLKEQIINMEKTIESISAQVDKQIELIKKLRLETKSLERVKTSRFDEYKKEDLKAVELQMEEFVSTAKIMKKSV